MHSFLHITSILCEIMFIFCSIILCSNVTYIMSVWTCNWLMNVLIFILMLVCIGMPMGCIYAFTCMQECVIKHYTKSNSYLCLNFVSFKNNKKGVRASLKTFSLSGYSLKGYELKWLPQDMHMCVHLHMHTFIWSHAIIHTLFSFLSYTSEIIYEANHRN